MPSVQSGPSQYILKFGEQTIVGSPYALKKLGFDQTRCFLKIEEYMILCIPFQLGFKRSTFMASLSKQEKIFFQKYANSTIGLSISLNPDNRPEPFKFFIRCTLSSIGKMKGREDVGLFVLDYKTPDEMTLMLGNYMEVQERIKNKYDDYGKTLIKISPETANTMGYNMFSTITEPGKESRRILVLSISSKFLEYAEAEGSPVLEPDTQVSFQLYFKKYRISVNGKISAAGPLPQRIIRSVANLEFNPELVDIIDAYWYGTKKNQKN